MLVIGNLLRYMHAKNYQNIHWFDKVIAKIKWCSFLLTWYSCAASWASQLMGCLL